VAYKRVQKVQYLFYDDPFLRNFIVLQIELSFILNKLYIGPILVTPEKNTY